MSEPTVSEAVRRIYDELAAESSCCPNAPAGRSTELIGYNSNDLASIPTEADLGLGRGCPLDGEPDLSGKTV